MSPPDVNPGAAGQPTRPLPADALIVVPVRNTVLFPEIVFPITVGRPSSIAAAQQAVREQRQILIVLQRDPEMNDPTPDDLYRTGTVANIVRYVTSPEGGHHLICQGVQRFRITEFVEGYPFLLARGLHIAEPTSTGPEIEARFIILQEQVREALDLLPRVPPEMRQTVEATTSPAHAGRPRRDLSRRHADGEAGHPGDHRSGAAARQGLQLARPSPGSAAPVRRDRQQDQGLARRAASARCCCASRWPPSSASWATRAPTSRTWPTSRRRSPRPRCRPRSRPWRRRSCAACSARPRRRPSTA